METVVDAVKEILGAPCAVTPTNITVNARSKSDCKRNAHHTAKQRIAPTSVVRVKVEEYKWLCCFSHRSAEFREFASKSKQPTEIMTHNEKKTHGR